jgi:hypothetical protein
MGFLAVVVDCNGEHWAEEVLAAQAKDDPKNCDPKAAIQHLIGSVIALCNGHMLGRLANQLVVLASGLAGPKKKLFSTEPGFLCAFK